MLEPRADLRVVQRKRGSITESLCELELVLVEERLLAEPVDVECALDRVARDQRNRDQRLRLVSRCSRHRRRARIQVGLVHEHRLAMLDAPAGEPDPKWATVGQDLVGPLVTRPHGDQQTPGLVGLVDGQRVVRNELRQGIRNPVEQCVEALLGEHVVEDVRQPAIGLDARGALGRIGERSLLEQAEWESMVAHRHVWVRLCSRSGVPFFKNRHTAKRRGRPLESPGRGVPVPCERS